MNRSWLPTMVKRAASAPPTIANVAAGPSASAAVRLSTALVFSATLAPAADVIAGATSLTFVTPMVNACVTDEPSVDVARTMIAWLAAVSKSSAPATVTTPVLASMANRPPASLSREYVTASVASGSSASAVTPTAVPITAFSATAFGAPFASTGVSTGPTWLSVVSSDQGDLEGVRAAQCADGRLHRDGVLAGSVVVVEQGAVRDRHRAGRRVDYEGPARAVGRDGERNAEPVPPRRLDADIGTEATFQTSAISTVFPIASALSFAAYVVLGRRAFSSANALAIVAGSTRYGLFFLLPGTVLELATVRLGPLTFPDVLLLLYLGAGYSALAFVLCGYGLARLEAGQGPSSVISSHSSVSRSPSSSSANR